MKKFKLTFQAIKLRSIKKPNKFVKIVEAKDPWNARCKLYDNYEHVQIENIEEVIE